MGGDAYQLLETMPYPGDEDLPFGADFADSLILSPPRSDPKAGVWWFDGIPHTCVTIQGLRRSPHPGHYTAERAFGEQAFALFDQMPEGTCLTLVIVFKPQYQILNHIVHVMRTAIGEGAESLLVRETGDAAQRALAEGDKIYPLDPGGVSAGPRSRELASPHPPAQHPLGDPRDPTDRGSPRLDRARRLHPSSPHELRAAPRAGAPARAAHLLDPYREPLAPLRALHRHRPSGHGLLQPGRRARDLRSLEPAGPQEERPHADRGTHGLGEVRDRERHAAPCARGAPAAHLYHRCGPELRSLRRPLRISRSFGPSGGPRPQRGREPPAVRGGAEAPRPTARSPTPGSRSKRPRRRKPGRPRRARAIPWGRWSSPPGSW